ncbi:MAG TPA: ATP-binding protein [Acidobacteriota bacterium]|nr:ATP-binding protein [Acidobacteriota bacterium]
MISSIIAAAQMKKMTDRIEVIISSTLDNLDLIQTLADGIADFMHFDADTAHWIGMSVRESVTNAIQHGNKLDPQKKVDICFEIKPDRLCITVRDQGRGFEAGSIPNPLEGDNLLKPSGRGIFYIRTFMDEVRFNPLIHGGMEVVMMKKMPNN